MKRIYNQKWLIISILSLIFIMIFSIKVYATDEPFAFKNKKVDVTLNTERYILYENGSGTISWESSNTDVATVSEFGLVSGLKIGTTTITATRGGETDTCIVNVVYDSINIGGQYWDGIDSLNLILNEYDTEKLKTTIKDGMFEIVDDAIVTWTSSDESVVTIDQKGTIKGLKAGTATITATAAGVSDTCEVFVYNGPEFTDFSNAKYELLFDLSVDLKITGVTSKEDSNYYYIITSDKTKPTLPLVADGDCDDSDSKVNSLSFNEEKNWFYVESLDEFVELNGDLYIWIIESVELESSYDVGEDCYISYSTKFVVEGEELKRPEWNSILRSFYIWGGEDSDITEKYSSISFRFPTAVEKRKFKIKVGKVTDNSILQKIQNNDYSGITSLLAYAKNNNAVYTTDLTTTEACYFSADEELFDGLTLLEDQAYYYIYVELDDENGKYYPLEGVTLGQASINSSNKYWELFAYTNKNFEWNNLSSTPVETEKKEEKDNTTTSKVLPDAGTKLGIVLVGITLLGVSVFVYRKYSKLKDI